MARKTRRKNRKRGGEKKSFRQRAGELRSRVLAFAMERRRKLSAYCVGVLVIAMGMILAYNSATGYEYSYRGTALGVVKAQEDVTGVLNVINAGIGRAPESIEKEMKDFSFRKVVVVGRTVDSADDVLAKLSYIAY